MLVRLQEGVGDERQEAIRQRLAARGCEARRVGHALVVIGGSAPPETAAWDGVAGVDMLPGPHRLVARAVRPEGSVVFVGGVPVGGPELVVMAGPCSVESEGQVMAAARAVAGAGARLLRGGAFKPRTSPYAFQGLGREGLRLLARAGHAVGLPTVTEVLAPEDVGLVAEHADALQVGARNVQNFALLKALGRAGRPVLLKRGMSSTVEELLLAAEYVVAHGNAEVILCERGIRTFEPATRNTLDLSAVALLKALTHLPVIVDPSHGTGRRDLVAPLSKAAVAAGADGLLVEVHPAPEQALSDGAQSLTPEGFSALMRAVAAYAALEGRTLGPRPARPAEDALLAYRDRIDGIDEALVRLLNERARLALGLARVKQSSGLPMVAPDREASVLEHVCAASGAGPLDPEAMARMFTAIIAETRAAQARVA
jgi:3-deoxy-7-phosphoheptulonate synthase